MIDTPPIVFMHMMKTGGLTMVNILGEAFGPDHTFKLGNTRGDTVTYLDELESAAKDPAMRVFIGHFGWGVQHLFNRPVQFATILRHPVDRVLSLIRYLGLPANDTGFLSEALSALPEARDGMVRRLNGLTQADFSAGDTRDIDWRDMSRTDISIPLSDRHLDTAIQALDGFSVIGLQEKFPETLLLFRDRLDTPPLFNITRPFLNNSENPLGRNNADPAIVALIEENNRLDLELYHRCRKEFDRTIGELERRCPVEMSVQRLLNNGLARRGVQVLDEDEAFATIQEMINGLLRTDRLKEAACLLCFLLSKPLDRETAEPCLILLRKIGSRDEIQREESSFTSRYGNLP